MELYEFLTKQAAEPQQGYSIAPATVTAPRTGAIGSPPPPSQSMTSLAPPPSPSAAGAQKSAGFLDDFAQLQRMKADRDWSASMDSPWLQRHIDDIAAHKQKMLRNAAPYALGAAALTGAGLGLHHMLTRPTSPPPAPPTDPGTSEDYAG